MGGRRARNGFLESTWSTRIANAPAFLKGLINLRGQIVPIEDMRLRLDLGGARYGGAGCLHGLGTVGERMLVLLDIERPMTAPGTGLVSSETLPLAA